ncbi:EamA family transporter [Spirosoma koreense]
MLLAISSLTTFAVVIRIVANPLSNVFQKQLTQRSSEPVFIIWATYGFLTLACLPFWPQLGVVGLPVAFWQSMLLTGLLAMLGNVFLVKALHLGDLSVLGPINAYKSVVGLLIGVFLLNEVPRFWGIAGMLLIIAGSYIVLVDRKTTRDFSREVFQRPAIKLRLLALVLSAADGAFLKKAILLSTPAIAFFYWCLLGFTFTCIWILLTMRSQWRQQTQLLVRQRFTFLPLFITVGITQLASNVALNRMPVGYALALFQTSALLSVLFGYQFFNERGLVRKLVGAGVMVTGAVLITILG